MSTVRERLELMFQDATIAEDDAQRRLEQQRHVARQAETVAQQARAWREYLDGQLLSLHATEDDK